MENSEITASFGVSDIASIYELKSGHINRTFLVECFNGEKYILQSLNSSVFRDPEAVMGNIRIIEELFNGADCGNVCVPQYVITADGKNYIESDGEIYRLYRYVEPITDNANQHYLMGFSFGTFMRLLNGKGVCLAVTIEKFHSFSNYFSLLTSADNNSFLKKIDKIIMMRLDSVCETLQQVFTVDFIKRNVHNDAKSDNIIFGEKCTVIDLDTAMSGYAAIDYGDMIRSACTAEQLNFTIIRDITRGFANGLSGLLTDDEIYSLYYGILYVTGELAVRYLIDYLSNEKYFKGRSSAYCLSRANDLLRQLNLFIKHGEDITSIIYKAFKKQ